ncbi:MAG TPA: hypothetical protein VGD14_06960 [bacterium]
MIIELQFCTERYLQLKDKTEYLGIKKVIVRNIGPAVYNEVTSFGCTVYLCHNMPFFEAVKKVSNDDIPLLKEPTLKYSIHSACKAGDDYGGRGEGCGTGKGMERNLIYWKTIRAKR